MTSWRLSSVRPYIILALLVAAAFANSFHNQFVWDDYRLIVFNRNMDISLADFPLLFFKSLWKFAGVEDVQDLYYRPMLSVFNVLNFKVWGPNPEGYHLVNVLLHLFNAFLLYRVGRLTSGDARVALVAASLFAVHPVHNESVGRAVTGEPLFGIFLLLTLYFFQREVSYASLIFFFCALFTKEFAVMLPPALFLLAMHRKGVRESIVKVAPYMLLVGIYLIMRTKAIGFVLGHPEEKSLPVRAFTMAAAAFDYLRLLAIPYPLHPYYPGRWYPSAADPKVLLSLSGVAVLAFAAFRARRNKLKLFLLFLPLLLLCPVIWHVSALRAGEDYVYISERYLYAPAMFFTLLAAESAAELAGGRKRILDLSAALLCVLFVLLTFTANRIWRDNYSFFGKVVEEFPTAGFARYNLGVAYHNDGRYQEAASEFSRFLLLDPKNLDALYYLGRSYEGAGMPDQAAEAYKNSLKINPAQPALYERIGIICFQQERLREAEEAYRTAIMMAPNSAATHNNLGLVLYKQGRLDEAALEYARALKLDAGRISAHYNLGLLYDAKGEKEEAAREFQAVLRLQPQHPHARQRLDALRRIEK